MNHNQLSEVKRNFKQNNKYYSLVINIDGPKIIELKSNTQLEAEEESEALGAYFIFTSQGIKSFNKEIHKLINPSLQKITKL